MVTCMCHICPPKVVGGLFAFGDKYSPFGSPLMILILFDLSRYNFVYGTGSEKPSYVGRLTSSGLRV
jgi:hypothetical protein